MKLDRLQIHCVIDEVKQMKQMKPTTLYLRSKLGKVMVWTIWTENDTVCRQSGYEGGKLKDVVYRRCNGKNIGRTNETTGKEQACLEAQGFIDKQIDKGYTYEHPDASSSTTSAPVKKGRGTNAISAPIPMLANKWVDKKSKIVFPCTVQAKIDGIRCITQYNGVEVALTSRLSKPMSFKDHIRSVIEDMSETYMLLYGAYPCFDGELYSHSLQFNQIQSIVKRQKNKHEDDKLIEYWIFDLIVDDVPFEERWSRILKVYEECSCREVIRLVPTVDCMEEDEIDQYHSDFVAEGYEGLIIRNKLGKYRQKYRSNDLLKHKEFDDEEMTVVGYRESEGTERGCIVFSCEWEDTVFDVRPRGPFEPRKKMFRKGDKYVGRTDYTVRFQGIGSNGAPRFPVGIGFRDGM
jgi:ATP-dependent DNA ligase